MPRHVSPTNRTTLCMPSAQIWRKKSTLTCAVRDRMITVCPTVCGWTIGIAGSVLAHCTIIAPAPWRCLLSIRIRSGCVRFANTMVLLWLVLPSTLCSIPLWSPRDDFSFTCVVDASPSISAGACKIPSKQTVHTTDTHALRRITQHLSANDLFSWQLHFDSNRETCCSRDPANRAHCTTSFPVVDTSDANDREI